MAIDFPTSPTNGQKFVSSKTLYTYDSTAGVWNASALPTALTYNYCLNPSFRVSQQNASTAGTTSGYFFADMWQQSGSLPQTVARAAGPSPNGSQYIHTLTVSTPKVTLAATADYTSIIQVIEGTRMTPWYWGYTLCKPVVVRFWFKSTVAGTFGAGFRTAVATPTNYRGCHQAFTISAGQINTWVEVVLAFPGDNNGYPTGISTYPLTTANSTYLWIIVAASAGYQTAPGVWASGNFIAPTGMTNGVAATATFSVADVGIYLDPGNTGRAPLWETVDEGQVMQDVQRYWYKAPSLKGHGTSVATTIGRMACNHPVTMRVAPTFAGVGCTCYDATVNNAMTVGASACTDDILEFNATGTGLGLYRALIMVGNVSTVHCTVTAR